MNLHIKVNLHCMYIVFNISIVNTYEAINNCTEIILIQFLQNLLMFSQIRYIWNNCNYILTLQLRKYIQNR